MNDRHIKNDMESALEQMNAEVTYLVPPPSIDMELDERVKSMDHDGIRIPYITCYGLFNSSIIPGFGSSLTIVWYQDGFATPIEESVLEHIKTIDWDKVAEGYEF